MSSTKNTRGTDRLAAHKANLERQQRRTQLTEELLDVFIEQLTAKLRSDKCRSQDLVAAASFFRRNGFKVNPSTEGTPDPLDNLIRQREEDAKRLKNMERAKAKSEKRAIEFYRKQENPTEPTPRLNAGDPGPIFDDDGSDDDEGST